MPAVLGVPVVIGSKGVEKILELPLNKSEKTMFLNSVKAVYGLAKACKNIDKDLVNFYIPNNYLLHDREFKIPS